MESKHEISLDNLGSLASDFLSHGRAGQMHRDR
jgi:hypothetical protein